MKVKELKKLLKDMPDESEVVLKFHVFEKHEICEIYHDKNTGKVIIDDAHVKKNHSEKGEWICICSTQSWQYTYEHYKCSLCGTKEEYTIRQNFVLHAEQK